MFPTGNFLNRVQNGFAWTADTTVQALTLLQYLRFKAANPTNSNTIVQIYAFGGWAGASVNLTVYTDTTTAVTTNTLTPKNQNRASSNAAALTVTWDINGSNVNGSYYRTIPIGTTFQSYTGEVIFLYPGQTLAFSCIPGVATNAIMHMSWIEQAMTQ
jgi:hypothetical protein